MWSTSVGVSGAGTVLLDKIQAEEGVPSNNTPTWHEGSSPYNSPHRSSCSWQVATGHIRASYQRYVNHTTANAFHTSVNTCSKGNQLVPAACG